MEDRDNAMMMNAVARGSGQQSVNNRPSANLTGASKVIVVYDQPAQRDYDMTQRQMKRGVTVEDMTQTDAILNRRNRQEFMKTFRY